METIPPEDEVDSPNSADPLVLLRRLIPHLDDDDLDLDAIDGEFFWRCCRCDLWPVPCGDWLRLRDGMVRLDDGLEITSAGRTYHNRLWESLDDDWNITDDVGVEPPSMYAKRPGSKPLVEMRVFSNRWTGEDVEKRIASHVSEAQRFWARSDRFEPRPEPSLESVVVDVTFSFAPAGTEVTHPTPTMGTLEIDAPHIVVVVGLPLPPAGTIAKHYDDNVRRERQWHQRLTGAPVRQEKHVALRTWATGLLVASGRKTLDAMRDVCAILGEDEVTQVQFTEDRRHLVERVPEAESFLYAKPPRRPFAHNR